jgi:hypothetical protein
METAGNACRSYDLQQSVVIPDIVRAEAFTHIRI